MIGYDEALQIAKDRKEKIDECTEYENAFVFSYTGDAGYVGGYGHTPVTVMKDGKYMYGITALLDGSVGEEIRSFPVAEQKEKAPYSIPDDAYVEPAEYFTPEMLKIAEEWERKHGDINCDGIEIFPEEKN